MTRRSMFSLAVVWLGLAACQPADTGRTDTPESAEPAHVSPPVIEITARDYAFIGPDEIPSGWVTLRLVNEGMEHHFLLMNRLPDDRSVEDYINEVAIPFDSVWTQLRTGAMDKAQAGALLGELLPEWYGEVRALGGPGFIGPGGAAEVTMNLLPGNYLMECYVKTPDGDFHGVLGMARPVTVTEESTGAGPPRADMAITLFNHAFVFEGTPRSGPQVVAVHFDEQPEIGLGNDVHVARLGDDVDVDTVIEWMDWMNVEGLRAPSPVEFVGGIHEMPPGMSGFFTLDLAPGRYVWIAESGASLGMVEEFVIE